MAGETPPYICSKLFIFVIPPPYYYSFIPVGDYEQMPVTSTPIGGMMNLYIHEYEKTYTDLLSGEFYQAKAYYRTGYGPGYTYTEVKTENWTQ